MGAAAGRRVRGHDRLLRQLERGSTADLKQPGGRRQRILLQCPADDLVDGVVTRGDEALTPGSSRFWPGDSYSPGGPQPAFDKQYVRDYCLGTGWDRTYPGPEVPDDVVAGTRARYVEAFERLTGIPFERYLSDPKVVL